MKVTQLCPTLCDPMDCKLCNSPGQNTGVGSLSLLLGIFLTQGSNPGLPHCRQILYQLSLNGRVEGRVRQIPSPYGVGGETGYPAQKDLKLHGGGKDDKGVVFLFLHSKALLGFICFFILGSPQSPHFGSVKTLFYSIIDCLLIIFIDTGKTNLFFPSFLVICIFSFMLHLVLIFALFCSVFFFHLPTDLLLFSCSVASDSL